MVTVLSLTIDFGIFGYRSVGQILALTQWFALVKTMNISTIENKMLTSLII